MPFSTSLCGQIERIHATSFQLTVTSNWLCVHSASVMPPKPGPPGRCPSTFAKVRRLPFRMRHAQVGRRSTSNTVFAVRRGGTERPLRMSTWRCPFTGRSTVTNSAEQPAFSARSISAFTKPRSRIT